MFSAIRRSNSQVLKYHIMLEPLEFRFAKPTAKDKDKVLPGPCILAWEKSPRLSKSKPLEGKDGKVVWPPAPQTHPLQLIITMYKKDNKFLSKKTSLKAKIITAKGEEKTVGKCEIDVAEYCVDKEISHPPVDLKMGGDCVMRCRLHSRPLPQGASGGGDDISMMSGLSNMEEPSAVSDWAVGFGKNKGPDASKSKGALDSDSDNDEDDLDDFAGFGTSRNTKPKQPTAAPVDPVKDGNDSDDEFVGIPIPNSHGDDVAALDTQPEVPEIEISKVMQAEIVPTPVQIEIKPPTKIEFQDDSAALAQMQQTADHTQCEEFLGKYKTQVDQLLKENSSYHSQLQLLQNQHSDDIQRFQGIVTLSQTSLNKMQDVVAEYKKREDTYQLQLSTLQKKVKDDEKSLGSENKRLAKENQIHQQDVTILNSKITSLKETLRHKEEAEQRLVIQMKTTGDTESILLGEKTQLENKLQESEGHTKLLKVQLDGLTKERDAKAAQVIENEKNIEKMKQLTAEYEKQSAAFKHDLSTEREKSLVQAQQLAQLEHTLAVKDKEIAGQGVVVEKKEQELVELKTLLSTKEKTFSEKEAHLSTILQQFESLQDQVYKLEAEKATLKQQNDTLVVDNQAQKDNYNKLQQDLQKSAANNTNKDSQTQSLQQQLTALQATITTLEAYKVASGDKEKSYQEQVNTLSQDKAKLNAALNTSNTDLAKLRDENQSLTQQNEELKSTLHSTQVKHDELLAKFNNVNPQLQDVKKVNIDLTTKIQSNEASIKKLEDERVAASKAQQHLRDHIVELELDNDNYKTTTIPALEKSLKEHKAVIETQQTSVEHKEAEVAALSAALESLKQSKNSSGLVTSLSSSSTASNNGDALLALEEGYERIAITELARIRDELSFLTTTLDKRTDKIGKLNEEIERLHEEHEEFLQLRQQMEEDFNELEHERDELDQKLNVLSAKFDVLQQQNERIKTQQVDVDQDEVKKLHLELDSTAEQYRQVKERYEQVKSEASKSKNELNHMESLVTDLNTKLNITETKLENSEANCKNVLDKSTELAAQLNTELTRAHLENRSLRDRIHTFDTLTATVTAIISGAPQLKGAKLESRIVEELIGKIDYYQTQLAEADETLLQTKQTWKQTSDVLTRRILDLEDQLKQLKREKIDLEHARGQDEGEQSKMKNIVNQQQQQKEKYQEALSKFEIQLIAKRVEITEVTKERDLYKEQVEMYENNIESYEAQLNASRQEVEQLRETLAAVSGQGKKGKKSKRSQQQQPDYDLDDADF